MYLTSILIGLAFAVAIILLAKGNNDFGLRTFYAGLLVIVAFLYVLFSIYGVFFAEASVALFLMEIGGLILFSIFAYLGLKSSFWYLAFGWAFHTVWDVALHSEGLPASAYTPSFYTAFCIGVDLLIAIYLVLKLRSN